MLPLAVDKLTAKAAKAIKQWDGGVCYLHSCHAVLWQEVKLMMACGPCRERYRQAEAEARG